MKNLNADFLLDIWAELKAKRLAPVAIGLVVLAIAMPALMLKGEEAPGDTALPIAAPAVADGAKVEVAEELAERGSKLDSYESRDPFDGLVNPKDEASGDSGTAIAPGDLLDDGDKADSGSSGGGEPSGGKPGGGSGGSGGSGGLDDGSTDTTSPGGGTSEPPPATKPRRSYFNYRLDVKFGRPGREKRYRNLARMSFLPNPKLPTLLFMGVPEGERSALFLVHPGLNHQGQGECVPSRNRCNFLELGIGKEHYISANDHEFRIRLIGVKRVKLSAEKKQRATARRASRTKRSARTNGEANAPAADEEQYDFPWLVDGVG